MRRLLAMLTGAVMVATACGSSATPLSSPDELATTAPAAEFGAARVLTQAAEAELTAVRMALTAEFGGMEELDGETVSFSMEAAFSENGDRGEMMLDFGEVMDAAAAAQGGFGAELVDAFGGRIEMRFIDSTVYMSSGFWAWLFPVDTPWVAFVDDGSAPMDTGFDQESFSAEEFLALLELVDDDAVIVGDELIDGVETVHVRGRVSVADLAALDPAFLEDLDPANTGGLDVDVLEIDVWVGPGDVVRRLVFGAEDGEAFMRFTLDLTDVGGSIDVVAPPADEITWMDDLMAGAFEFGA